jgi:hypothetical protein
MAHTTSLLHSTAVKHQYPPPIQSKHMFNAHLSTSSHTSQSKISRQAMKSAEALGLLDSQQGGRYHVPRHLPEPYTVPLTVCDLKS